jgi:hypothetical protein
MVIIIILHWTRCFDRAPSAMFYKDMLKCKSVTLYQSIKKRVDVSVQQRRCGDGST